MSAGAEAAPLSRRERRKREVHERILAAAVALFDDRGPRDTTVAEICARADVAHKTFFNHFPTKQHVLRAIAEAAMEELLVDIEDLRKQPGRGADRVERFFALLVDNAEASGPMHRELVTEIIHSVHDSGSEARQARRLREAFEALVRDGTDARDLERAHELETLTEMVQGAFYVLMLNWAHLEAYPLRERAAATARFLGRAMAHTTGEEA